MASEAADEVPQCCFYSFNCFEALLTPLVPLQGHLTVMQHLRE